MLGGVTRMTISLTVILLETTNDMQYLIPIMLTLMISKWIGDLFNPSLYDLHVELACIPFIEPNPPRGLENLEARDIMKKPVVYFASKANALQIMRTLERTTHNGFPVVNSSNNLIGLITRNQLIVLLKRHVRLMDKHIWKEAIDPETQDKYYYNSENGMTTSVPVPYTPP